MGKQTMGLTNNKERKIIEVTHHVDDYECMWNGIEDLYMTKTGEKVPSFFFFAVAGTGNFVYLKQNKGPVKRMVAWSDGRVKTMYEFMKDIVGFEYKHIEGRSFGYAMKKAKEQIDEGNPVVLGCLDMYYLSYYPKFYGKEHIPIHFVLMVGYNDEKECAYIRDCGVEGIQKMSYETLEKALDIENIGVMDKNTVCLIHFKEQLPSVIEIAREGFKRKAEMMLEPPVGFIGIKGMRKLADEIETWKETLSKEDYEAALRWIVTYLGTVPSVPARLKGEEQEFILHQATREKLAGVLSELGEQYEIKEWIQSAEDFLRSGKLMEEMNNQIVDYLLNERTDLSEVPPIIRKVADIEEIAFTKMRQGAQQA